MRPVLVLLVAFGAAGCAAFGSSAGGERLARLEALPQFREGQLQNDETTEVMREGTGRVVREFLFGNGLMREPSCTLPLVTDGAERIQRAPGSGLRITWLGHSTTLIEIDGKTVLTDPMWSERASPFGSLGPRRFHPPPLALERLPKLDAVLVSHDHYDHLDMATVRRLAATGVVFHTGVGVGAHLEGWGVPRTQIVEHAWWEEFDLGGGVRIVSTPARHFSGRGLSGGNRALWTSWVLAGPTHRLFFSGDTGQTRAFEQVREKLGPFDVAMLEIGQWDPAWGDIHLGPLGALKAYRALGAKRLFPIHWATFELGLHAWSEPAETLVTEGEKAGATLLTPRLGQPVEPEVDSADERWWRALPPIAVRCPPGSDSTKRSLDDWAL